MILHPAFILIALTFKSPKVSLDFKLMEIDKIKRIDNLNYIRAFRLLYEIKNQSNNEILFNPNSIFLFDYLGEENVEEIYGFSPFYILSSKNLKEYPTYDESLRYDLDFLKEFQRQDTIRIQPNDTYMDTLKIIGINFYEAKNKFNFTVLQIRKIDPNKEASIKIKLSYYPPLDCDVCFQGPVSSKIKTFVYK
jgi:hypothetical protein